MHKTPFLIRGSSQVGHTIVIVKMLRLLNKFNISENVVSGFSYLFYGKHL